MIAPCGQKDDDSGKHQQMLADVTRNFDFRQRGRSVLRHNQFTDDLDCAVFYIPDDGHQCGKEQDYQQLFPHKQVEGQRKYVETDVLAEYGIRAAKGVLV